MQDQERVPTTDSSQGLSHRQYSFYVFVTACQDNHPGCPVGWYSVRLWNHCMLQEGEKKQIANCDIRSFKFESRRSNSVLLNAQQKKLIIVWTSLSRSSCVGINYWCLIWMVRRPIFNQSNLQFLSDCSRCREAPLSASHCGFLDRAIVAFSATKFLPRASAFTVTRGSYTFTEKEWEFSAGWCSLTALTSFFSVLRYCYPVVGHNVEIPRYPPWSYPLRSFRVPVA